MKITTKKTYFEFSNEEKKALEKVKSIFTDLSSYCSIKNTTIYFNGCDYEFESGDCDCAIEIINDLLSGNYDAD